MQRLFLACRTYIRLSGWPLQPPHFHPDHPPANPLPPSPGSKSVVITSETRRSYQLDESMYELLLLVPDCHQSADDDDDYGLVVQARFPHRCSTYINLSLRRRENNGK